MKKQIERIIQMEEIYEDASNHLQQIEELVNQLSILNTQIQVLKDYQDSGKWMEDYLLDEHGMLPSELKRGVLAEDGLYELIISYHEILNEMKSILDIK